MVQYGARVGEKWLYCEEVRSTDEREVGYHRWASWVGSLVSAPPNEDGRRNLWGGGVQNKGMQENERKVDYRHIGQDREISTEGK